MTPHSKPPAARLPSPARRPSRRRGMALVITLSLVVLAAFAVMAFFVRATSNRVVENTRAQQLLAEQTARTAADHVTGRFLAEITQNSTAFTDNGKTVYLPQNAAAMIPARLLADPGMAANATFASLVRQSSPSADPAASSHSSAAPAQNGRLLSPAQWNSPRLLPGAGFSSNSQLPNWIYLNRDGALTATPSSNSTIGRFAYNIYQTAGLLDANVAGQTSVLSNSAVQALKFSSAAADLTALDSAVTQTAIDALVQFRSPSAAGTSAQFENYVRGQAQSGFLAPPSDGRFFASRQDLLRYVNTQNPDLASALPYLTHTTSTLAAPSWSPATPSGSTINYAAQANSASAPNRFFPNVRVINSFTRADGSTAQPGDPLVTRRFPLSKLAWLGPNGPAAGASPALIQRDFGLRWNPSTRRWDYVGHSGAAVQSAIKTLHQVAQEDREPNFFELLKAAILSGSVGRAAQNKTLADLGQQTFEDDEDLQIIRIGACLIDQADSDNFPSHINLGGVAQFGVEDLPYLHTMPAGARWRYRVNGGYINSGIDFTTPTAISIEGYAIVWAPKLFKPHVSSVAPSSGPAQIRVRLSSGTITQITQQTYNISFGNNTHTALNVTAPINLTALPQTELILPASSFGNFQATPKIVEQNEVSNPACSIPNQLAVSFWNTNPTGDRACGFVPFQMTVTTNHTVTSFGAGFRLLLPRLKTTGLMIVMEYFDGTTWRPYDSLAGHPDFPATTGISTAAPTNEWDIGGINFGSGGGAQPFGNSIGAMHAVYKIDLRSTRWAAMHGWEESRNTGPLAGLSWGFRYQKPFPPPILVATQDATNTGLWPEAGVTVNSGINAPHADGVWRVNDAARGAAANFFRDLTDTSRRPVILQRPFRTVAEMGYAFRDTPWQTLNFFHESSGDAGLLDVFCIEEEPALAAGKVNLNMAPAPVLRALVKGAARNPDGTALLDENAAANSFIAFRNARTALTNKSDLAAFVSSPQNSDAENLKHRREAVVRALADAGDTRSWGFLLDIAAQSGRFAPGPATPDRFIVEGEARHWVDLVIDRHTGRVLLRKETAVKE